MSRPLGTFDDFYPQTLSRKQPRLSKKQRKKLMQMQGRRKEEQGLSLVELVKTKEFKERVELLKKGGKLSIKASKIAYARGRIAAVKLAARIRKARSKSIYD